MSPTGICQLCLQTRELQKKSHIIPRFFQKALNPDGTFRGATVIDGKWKTRQDHFYAAYVFCRDCENQVFNKQAEHPISLDYLKKSNPFFNNDEVMMRMAVSICFRATMAKQSQKNSGDFVGAIRFWRRWLQTSPIGPLHYRVGVLT